MHKSKHAFILSVILIVAIIPFTQVAAQDCGGGPTVTNTNTSEVFCSIQEAIDDADTLNGHTLEASAGTFTEGLVIDKRLTLNGNGTVLDGTGLPGEPHIASIQTGGVTFNGFETRNFADGITVGYPLNTTPGYWHDIKITNNTVDNIHPGSPHGFGIYVGFEGEALSDGRMSAHLDFTGLVISGNQVNSTTNACLVLQSIDATSTMQVTGNTFTNCGASGTWFASARNINYQGNTIDAANFGIFMNSIPDGWYVANGNYGPKDLSITGNDLINIKNGAVLVYAGWPADIHINSNNIAGNASGITNTLGEPIDAPSNWWGDASGPGGEGPGTGDTISTNVNACVWLNAAYPGGTAVGTFAATNTNTGEDFCGIQAAIDAANPGDTINVLAGTFTEQVHVNKSVTLRGQGQGVSTILSPDALPLSFTRSGNDYFPVVHVTAEGAVIQNLTVDGAGKGNANNRFTGISYLNAGGMIDNVEVKGIRHTPFSGVQGGLGMYILSDDSVSRSITISNSHVHDYQKNGVTVLGNGLSVNIAGNTITGVGASGTIAQNGIQVSNGAVASVVGNTVSGHSWTGGTWVATNMYLVGDGFVVNGNDTLDGQVGLFLIGSGIVTNNTFAVSNSDTTLGVNEFYGLYGFVNGNGLEVSGNSMNGGGDADGASYGFVLYANDAAGITTNITSNTVENWGNGIYAFNGSEFGGTGSINITANDFSNNNSAGVVLDNDSIVALTNFKNNNISNNAAGLVNTGTVMLDAIENYWGDASGPGGEGPGTGDTISANVAVCPWYDSPVENGSLVYNGGTLDCRPNVTFAIESVVPDNATFYETVPAFDFTTDNTELFTGTLTLNPTYGGADASTDYTLPIGSFNVTQAVPAGWVMEDVTCVDRANANQAMNFTATDTSIAVDLAPDTSVLCSFSSAPANAGSIQITVDAGVDINTLFDFDFDGKETFSLSGVQSQSYTLAYATDGSFDVRETVPTDWELTQITVIGDDDDGSTVDLANGLVTVDLDDGENIQLKFLNETDEPPDPQVSLLVNGSFEIDADGDKVPDSWSAKNLLRSDKLKCNKTKNDGTVKIIAYEGDCAFQFKFIGLMNFNRKLKQKNNAPDVNVGDDLTFSLRVRVKKGAPGLLGKAIIFYDESDANGKPVKDVIRLRMTDTGGGNWVLLSKTITVTQPASKLKVVLKQRLFSDKLFIDDVRLEASGSTSTITLPGDLIPMPTQPGTQTE